MLNTRFLAVVATVAGALVLAAPGGASAPLQGTGASTLTSSTILAAREAGGNTIIEQLSTRADVGAFTGTVTEHAWLVVHPSGLITLHADASLTGTYAGCGSTPVTQSIRLAGQISPTGDVTATFATTDGAPIVVNGTVEGTTASNTVHFTITYHC
jgi:hypothetical protein